MKHLELLLQGDCSGCKCGDSCPGKNCGCKDEKCNSSQDHDEKKQCSGSCC